MGTSISVPDGLEKRQRSRGYKQKSFSRAGNIAQNFHKNLE